jgi:hypothetical protein
VHQSFPGDGPQRGNENWKPRTAGASSRWQPRRVRAKGAQAARPEPGRLEPVAGYSRQTGPDPTMSLMAERVIRMSQVILNSGLGPKLGPGQSKERRNRYVQIFPF